MEKEVVVERSVYIEKPAVQAPQTQGSFTGRIGDMEFELVKATSFGDRIEVEMSVVNNKMDDKLNYVECRFIDPEGNEFKSNYMESTFRNRNLIEGVTIRGTITFRHSNVQRVQNMAVIEINVHGDGNKKLGTLRFRGVPVTR